MFNKIGLTIVTMTVIAFILPVPTLATNGYSAHGWGTQSKSMAGVGVALSLDNLNAANNPATMVTVGHRLDLGLSLFSPARGYTADNNGSPSYPPATVTPGDYESDQEYFFIPNFAYNFRLNDFSSIGLIVGANGGMNTEYNNAVFSAFNNPGGTASTPTGIDLKQLFIGLPYARKLNSQQTVGIMPVFAIQSFKAYGLEPFQPFSNAPDQVTNNGSDLAYGFGMRLGWLGQLTERLSLGLSYQTKTYMTKFEDYKGLFAEQGDFDVPSTWVIGTAFEMTPTFTIALDIQRIYYSQVKAIGNRSDFIFMPGATILGTDDGLGFGWDDMTIFKLGMQWQYQPDLTVRAGYSHASQVIPHTQALFSILAPAVVRDHFTLGFGKKITPDSEINLSFMYAPNEHLYGSNPNTGPQTGHVEMNQYEIEIAWSRRW